jgi:hypothetical protein
MTCTGAAAGGGIGLRHGRQGGRDCSAAGRSRRVSCCARMRTSRLRSAQNAIHILGRWGDSESAAVIRSLLPTFDERGRINAVDAPGKLDAPDAEAAVLGLAEGDSPDVRRFAAYALSNRDTEAARRRLREMHGGDPARFVRAAAERGLRAGRGGERRLACGMPLRPRSDRRGARGRRARSPGRSRFPTG